jgi:hypothetical protein
MRFQNRRGVAAHHKFDSSVTAPVALVIPGG